MEQIELNFNLSATTSASGENQKADRAQVKQPEPEEAQKSPSASRASAVAARRPPASSVALRTQQMQMSLSQTETLIEDTQASQPIEQPAAEPHVYSISAINKAIRENLENNYAHIWLKGEISNFKAHSSGHFYFSLKDSKAQINAVMFRGQNQRLKFRPADGVEVIVRGKITVYEPRGTYQMFCELMEPVGAGALQVAFDQLKAKLQKEGLFDSSRKRALPKWPVHLAVVTSPTGAAIRDILNVLHRRFRGLRVTVIPALVQGEQAPTSIVKAIATAQTLADVDVMIVGRGGGSLEDLWAFNTEPVARAIASSQIPTISAVGHEVDFTIADFVADLRAPTPSAAAELVVRNAGDTCERVETYLARLRNLMSQALRLKHQAVTLHSKRLVDPRRRVMDMIQRLDELKLRLENSQARWVADRRTHIHLLRGRLGDPTDAIRMRRQKLARSWDQLRAQVQARLQRLTARQQFLMGKLDTLSPLKVVDRGYAIVTQDQKVVKAVEQIAIGSSVDIRLAHGDIKAQVVRVNPPTGTNLS